MKEYPLAHSSILKVVAEWEIKLLHSYLFCLTYKKYTQIANIQESLCITLQILVHLALYLQFKLAGWYENPIKSVVLTFPIEDIVFPTVTLCPEDSRPDRWGSVIKIFDQLNTDCESKRWDYFLNSKTNEWSYLIKDPR